MSRGNSRRVMVTNVPVAYELLAVDLAFAITTWKCQGATFA
jgi:hypothetical protein